MSCRLQPHIWITDDLLATAYRRFANTCVTGNVTSRRHGSNVPGPLEARRRAAKRRMAGLAVAGSAPTDFGALFGSGNLDMTSLWTPPSTSSSRSPIPPPPPPPQSSFLDSPFFLEDQPPSDPHLSVSEYRQLLDECIDLDALHRAHASLHNHPDVPVNFSRAAFRCLRKHASHEHLLSFLQSDLDHDRANNTHAYLQHLFTTNYNAPALDQYMNLVCDKLALGTLSQDELLQIVASLRDAPTSGIDAHQRHEALLSAFGALRTSLAEIHAPDPPPSVVTRNLLHAVCSLGPLPDVVKHIFAVFAWTSSDRQSEALMTLSKCLKNGIKRRTRTLSPPDKLLQPFLAALPSQHSDAVILSATKDFIAFIRNLDTRAKIETNKSIERLLCWLADLREYAPSILQPLSPGGSQLYPLLASLYTPLELGAFFQSLSPLDATQIILHHWVKPTILDVPDPIDHGGEETTSTRTFQARLPPVLQNRRAPSVEGPFATYGLTYTMTRSHRAAAAHLLSRNEREALFDKISSELQERSRPRDPEKLPAPGGSYVHLFVLLSQSKIEYGYWLDQIFRVLKSHKSPTWIYHFFSKLCSHNVHIPYPVASSLVRFFMDIDNPGWALNVFLRPDGNQWLSNLPELIFTYIERYPVSSEFLFKILNQPEYATSLPLNLRSSAQNPLSHERVQLIHHIAYALAKSPHLTPRAAFRRVCDCLDYLRSRNAPLSSLMSRALVFAGVTRSLREGRWLSTQQFKWLIKFVRELEGEETAQKLDEMAFSLRSENFELSQAQNQSLQMMKREADQVDWEFRKQFGHRSHRWKQASRPFKPWESTRRSKTNVADGR